MSTITSEQIHAVHRALVVEGREEREAITVDTSRLVCIGYVNGEAARDYLRYQAEGEDVYPPLPWRTESRHADTPLYIIEEVDG